MTTRADSALPERAGPPRLRRSAAGPGAPTPREIQERMLELLRARGTATSCPSEVARALSKDSWRPLMQPVREVAAALQREGLVDAYQHGRPVEVASARGALRLRLRAAAGVDYRAHPELYVVGRGEMGVLTVEPYKSELLPLWKFRTPELAKASSQALYERFVEYRRRGDFVGMDMARKFLQMGWTRARRYANHPGGRKYAKGTRQVLPSEQDPLKAQAAAIFKGVYDRVRADAAYLAAKKRHEARTAH